MSATVSSAPLQPSVRRAPAPIVIVLAAWFVAVFALGASGAFMAPPKTPPLALLVAFVAPIASAVIAYRTSTRFREWVLGIEPRLLVTLNAWRWAGFTFVVLYVYGILPGFFAWPAGLGDMAIGATAPWILGRLAASPSFATSSAYIRWNRLGLLDLFTAISLGAIGGFLLSDQPVTTAPMATLPLVLIPAFMVPIFILMHLAMLAQAKRAA
ncbi:MAG TPA: hypothetical protein VKB52_05945 [Rhodanobacteraceae bacterium]|nr:hypothetical protein [Rhodanobacteraceae bacterium]